MSRGISGRLFSEFGFSSAICFFQGENVSQSKVFYICRKKEGGEKG